jgi:hypothetical protein
MTSGSPQTVNAVEFACKDVLRPFDQIQCADVVTATE